MITLKSEAEFAKMDAAGRVLEDTFHVLYDAVKPGVTTGELDRIADAYIRSRGGIPSELGYCGYPKSICASVNEQVVHGIPGPRVLKDGDIVSLDIVVELDGYQADACRTFLVGNVPDEVKDLVRVTRECFFEALKVARPGYRIGDIGAAVQQHVESHGYGVVREMIGHGIGREMHEDPEVPNYGHAGHGVRLQAGMSICIEPMITLGSRKVRFGSDGWECCTADGKPAAHYENTVRITDGEPVLLTLHGEEIGYAG